MANKLFNDTYLCLGIIAFLLMASIPFQKAIDDERDKFKSIKQTILIPPKILKIMSLGYDEIISDIYWMRAIQYFYGDNLSDRNVDVTYKYFNIITELDPKFVNAYRYGASYLGEPHPLGLGNIQMGSDMYDKGKLHNPDNFRLPLEQGFMYFLNNDDHEKASELFLEASEKPGLNEKRRASIKGMAASALNKVGNRKLAKQIWMDIYENNTNEGRRNFALLNLKELNTKDIEDKLTNFAKKYEEKYGTFPDKIEDLLILKEVKKIPIDHEGNQFIIDFETKSVKSSTLNKQFLTTKSKDSKKY